MNQRSHIHFTKGSRNNTFQEFAPGFRADCVDLNEDNRRRSKAHVEDCATEDRLKLLEDGMRKLEGIISRALRRFL